MHAKQEPQRVFKGRLAVDGALVQWPVEQVLSREDPHPRGLFLLDFATAKHLIDGDLGRRAVDRSDSGCPLWLFRALKSSRSHPRARLIDRREAAASQ